MSKELLGFIEDLATVLETALLVTALMITVTSSISHVIRTYRLQSLLLAVVTGLAALIQQKGETPFVGLFVGLIVILPLGLAAGIRFLLARATTRPGSTFGWMTPQAQRAAERVWRASSETTVHARLADVAVFLSLVAVAFVISYQLFPQVDTQASNAGEYSQPDPLGLTISLSLLLTGLYIMIAKRDIISQIIGLLVMDHGLYLAVMKVVPDPGVATLFVIGLYFYTLITVAILAFLLPQVRRVTDEIDLDEIARQSELKG